MNSPPKRAEDQKQKIKEMEAAKQKKKVQELLRPASLVGAIVEKDVSTPSSLPLPTVLPFPVARHRSHGPHWTPANAGPSPATETGEEDADDSLFDPISSFADPIKRKEKKGLDFRRWKELIPGNDDNAPAAPVPRSVSKRKTPRPTVAPARSIEPQPVETVVREEERKATIATPMDETVTGEERTVMEDIEAENLARLSQMSAEEIAEAREEITGRMDPAVLEMLKKRGREKLGKKKDDAPEKKTKIGALNGDWMQDGELKNRSWQMWRERVEKVRDLRFYLDGSVLDDGAGSDQPNGNYNHIIVRAISRQNGVGYGAQESSIKKLNVF